MLVGVDRAFQSFVFLLCWLGVLSLQSDALFKQVLWMAVFPVSIILLWIFEFRPSYRFARRWFTGLALVLLVLALVSRLELLPMPLNWDGGNHMGLIANTAQNARIDAKDTGFFNILQGALTGYPSGFHASVVSFAKPLGLEPLFALTPILWFLIFGTFFVLWRDSRSFWSGIVGLAYFLCCMLMNFWPQIFATTLLVLMLRESMVSRRSLARVLLLGATMILAYPLFAAVTVLALPFFRRLSLKHYAACAVGGLVLCWPVFLSLSKNATRTLNPGPDWGLLSWALIAVASVGFVTSKLRKDTWGWRIKCVVAAIFSLALILFLIGSEHYFYFKVLTLAPILFSMLLMRPNAFQPYFVLFSIVVAWGLAQSVGLITLPYPKYPEPAQVLRELRYLPLNPRSEIQGRRLWLFADPYFTAWAQAMVLPLKIETPHKGREWSVARRGRYQPADILFRLHPELRVGDILILLDDEAVDLVEKLFLVRELKAGSDQLFRLYALDGLNRGG
jgi:hypothetical protein